MIKLDEVNNKKTPCYTSVMDLKFFNEIFNSENFLYISSL